jgi:predicted phage terminase large subunit-like protein
VLVQRREIFRVVEVFRGKFPFDTLKQKIIQVKRRYDGAALIIEDSPISKGLIQSLKEQSISVIARRPETDKRNRLIAQSDLFAAGSILLPRWAPWREDFDAELLSFPGRHDDQVDALTQGLAWGRESLGRRCVTRRLVGW